jgi:gas vesicle protein
MFRFVLGLVSGIAIGAAAANLSQGQSGQDLRAEFDRIRNDLQDGNFDALGAHLEERFKELQANLEARFAEVEEAAAEMADESLETEEVAEAAAEAAEEAVEEAEEAMEEVRA